MSQVVNRAWRVLTRLARDRKLHTTWTKSAEDRQTFKTVGNALIIRSLSSYNRRFPATSKHFLALGLSSYLLFKNWNDVRSSFAVKCLEDINAPPGAQMKKLFQESKRGNHFEVKRLLSNKQIDPNVRHPLGWTALHVAAVNGRYGVVEALLDAGADPDVKEEFSTAFRVAKSRRLNSLDVTIRREEEFHDSLNPNRSFEGSTALHYAALVDSYNTVKVLLEKGADPTVKNVLNHTAADYVRMENDAMRELLKKGMADFAKRKQEEELEERRRFPLEKRLHENIIGQDVAINAVAAAIRRRENGWVDDDHPLVFLFLGSSGIGKTELAKQVSLSHCKGKMCNVYLTFV